MPAVPPAASLEALLPRLDAVRAVVDSANRYRDDTPWAMRWGLYQGGSSAMPRATPTCASSTASLLPRFAARVKQRLVEYASEPEKLYVYLKAYLMLGEPQHLDKKHLQFLADLEWKAAGDRRRRRRVAVEALPEPARVRRHAAPDRAGSGARRAGAQHPPAGLDPADHVRPAAAQLRGRRGARLRLDVIAGVGIEKVFRRKSGAASRSRCRASTRKRSSRRSRERGMVALVKQFADDDWVWGNGGVSVASLAEARGAGHRSLRAGLHQAPGTHS